MKIFKRVHKLLFYEGKTYDKIAVKQLFYAYNGTICRNTDCACCALEGDFE